MPRYKIDVYLRKPVFDNDTFDEIDDGGLVTVEIDAASVNDAENALKKQYPDAHRISVPLRYRAREESP